MFGSISLFASRTEVEHVVYGIGFSLGAHTAGITGREMVKLGLKRPVVILGDHYRWITEICFAVNNLSTAGLDPPALKFDEHDDLGLKKEHADTVNVLITTKKVAGLRGASLLERYRT